MLYVEFRPIQLTILKKSNYKLNRWILEPILDGLLHVTIYKTRLQIPTKI